jgi:CheY-like chemotaxis protein
MTPAVAEPGFKPSRILVVDDDRAMCQLLIDLLREDGYEADVAYDGESALEKCRTTRFDLAITDLMMPPRDRRQRAGPSHHGFRNDRKCRRGDARGRVSLRHQTVPQ